MRSLTRLRALGSASAFVLAAPMLHAFAAAAPPKADEATDAAPLATALSLARTAVKAYGDAAASNILSPSVLAVTKQFADDHHAHVEALATALSQAGGTISTTLAAPVDIASLKTESDILAALYAVERTTAAAYLTALGELKNRDLARSMGAILGVVTTHVALLAEALQRGQPYPTGFVTA